MTFKDEAGNVIYETGLPAYSSSFRFTREMALSRGPIKRTVSVTLTITCQWHVNATSGSGSIGSWSRPASDQTRTYTDTEIAYDPVPTLVGDLMYEVTATTVTLSGVTVSGTYVGFVIARGDTANFPLSGVLETRPIGSLPYTWDDLEPDTDYYFRLAARDALAEVSGDYATLSWSDVLTIRTLAA